MSDTKGRVFVVQRPAYFDRDKNGWVNKYDLTPAAEFGELVFLLPPSNIYRDHLAQAMATLQERLEDFSPRDHVLAVGDPVAIAATVLVAGGRTGGRVSVLKYDRRARVYDAYVVDVSTNDG